jgi:hypothetical protein
MKKARSIIPLNQLRPTQITVGMLQVAHKQKRLREMLRRPAELVEFIIERPIRVVLGPRGGAYVIDHHHLALALIREKYETAPMDIEADFSALTEDAFWKKMLSRKFTHPYDAEGKQRPLSRIPRTLKALEDDVYRSLAGFVREEGGYEKVDAPFAEFLWADYFRPRIHRKLVVRHFDKALAHAVKSARQPEAKGLPGFISRAKKRRAKR